MKKIFYIFCIGLNSFCFSQKLYKQIPDKSINQQRLAVGKKFAQEFLSKCEKNDYSKFSNFIIDKRAEKKLSDSIQTACENVAKKDGKVEILKLNSSYYHKYTKDYDPLELFVFDIKTEKNPQVKYLSVWVYKDQNVIGGLWLSTEKSLTRKSVKQK